MNFSLRRFLPSIVLSVLGPVVLYELLRGPLHSDVKALAIGGALPVVWTLGVYTVRRRLDPIGIVGVAGFLVGLVFAWLSGGNPIMLELRDSIPTGVLGLVAIVSAVLGRPLLVPVIRSFAKRDPRATAILRDPVRVRRLGVLTVLVGIVLAVHGAALLTLAFSVPVSTYVVASRLVGWTVIGVGVVAILGYRRWATRAVQPTPVA